MSPEALEHPPTYTNKLDVFSCGVQFVQLITRKWPKPGPRMRTVQNVNDPRFPSGQAFMVVPEFERRKDHLNIISHAHPLLPIALDCIKDKEDDRLTAEQLCSWLIALKESAIYQDSIQQITEEIAPPARDQDQEQREKVKVDMQQPMLQKEEEAKSKDDMNLQLQQPLEASRRANEEVLHNLQQKNVKLQEKDGLQG